jgi:hypothetical protein
VTVSASRNVTERHEARHETSRSASRNVTLFVTDRHTLGVAKSAAERARAYRARKRQQALAASPVPRSAANQALLARVRERAESAGVSLPEVIERLLTAYAEGKLNVPPKPRHEPLASPKRPEPPASPPPQPEEELPPEPPQFQSELMRRMREQG